MAKRRNSTRGPQFVELIGPVLEALKALGGSGRPNEVIDLIASQQELSDDLTEVLASGVTRFNKNVNWARFYLAKDGYIDSSQRGVWSLTEKGRTESLTHAQALELFHRVHEMVKSDKSDQSNGDLGAEIDNETADDSSALDQLEHRKELLDILQNLPDAGFEKFCQRLLREAGFEQVKVTGRSGDGGIDGQGILKINHFVSFQVAFQSKRYSASNPVGSGVVRDFRGAIMGRADKGIILTTGSFTSEARREATRDGATPIELVDGEQIITMLEELELGLHNKRTVTLYEVNRGFFDDFR